MKISNNLLLPISLLFIVCNLEAQINITGIQVPENPKEGEFAFFVADVESESEGYLTYKWDFGDGETASLLERISISHFYKKDGAFRVNLKVFDEKGNESTFTSQVLVANSDPEIRFLNGEESNVTKRFVTFESVGFDPGEYELLYKWDFGDGNEASGVDLSNVSHTYDEKGAYTITLTLEDGEGGKDEKEFTIVVDQDWYGSVSGGQNHPFSGGASLFYQNRYDKKTGVKSRCFKELIFYDDNRKSLLIIALNDMSPLSNNTHPVRKGENIFDVMGATMFYNFPKSVYHNKKGQFMFMDIAEAGKNRQMPVNLGSIIPIASGSEWRAAKQFRAIEGRVNVDPLITNNLRGSFVIELEDDNGDTDNIFVEGEFDFTMSNYSFNQITKDGCENEVEEFGIIDHSPQNEYENVKVDYPCIEIEFSEPISLESLNSGSIQLGYPDEIGRFIPEEIRFENLSNERISIVPINPLRKGIVYEVKVKSGIDGVLSSSGALLDNDLEWKFNTEVNFSTPRIRIYQTIEDKPLVSNKYAMVRLEIDWERPTGVEESSRVTDFLGEVIIKNSSGQRVNNSLSSIHFKHSTLFNEEEIAKVRNSYEFYGWKPSPSDGNEITIEIHPRNTQCEPDPFTLTHQVSYYQQNHELKIDYYFLKVLDWKDSIPSSDRDTVNEIMRRNVEFAAQIYPVYRITAKDKKGYSPSQNSTNIDDLVAFRGAMFQEFYNSHALKSDADVHIIFYPFEVPNQKASFRSKFLRNSPYISSGPRRIIEIEYVNGQLPRPTVAHEMGHSFGLDHVPHASSVADRDRIARLPLSYWLLDESFQTTHGYRIFGDRGGANKNNEEENAEYDVLANFMQPNIKEVYNETGWISNQAYDAVKEHLDFFQQEYGFNDALNYEGRYWASNNLPRQAIEFTNIVIQGSVSKLGKLEFSSVSSFENLKNNTLKSKGEYVGQCLDKNGNVIGKSNFSVKTIEANCTFSNLNDLPNFGTIIRIPSDAIASKIEILKSGKVVSEFPISENTPTVEFLKPSSSDLAKKSVNIEWKGTDIDDDKLTYTLLYSPNGVDNWEVLSVTQATHFSMRITDLTSGFSPTFKIEASDGFNKSSDILNLEIKFPLNIITFGPRNRADIRDEIYLTFSNPIIPPAYPSKYFQILETKGDIKSSLKGFSVAYSDDFREARIKPFENLKSGYSYQIKYGSVAIAESSDNQVENVLTQMGDLIKNKQKEREQERMEDEKTRERVETPEEFFRDIFGIKKRKKTIKKKENNTKEKVNIIPVKIPDNYYLQDVFGNKLQRPFDYRFTYNE